MPIISTRGAAAARGFGFSGGGLFQVSLTITTDTTDYNLYTAATGTGWPGAKDAQINLTINPGVNVHASSTGVSAFNVPSQFPANTKVNITNAGIIVGRGGNGGAAQPAHGGMDVGLPGTPGGTGLLVNRPITLVNNNRVAGGGGGGGGGGGRTSPRAYGGGGGGGITFGLGGGSHGGPHGTAATATQVGTSSGSQPGGQGGSYGAAGGTGTTSPQGIVGGTGGASGTAVNGYSLITLSGTGQINGPTTG